MNPRPLSSLLPLRWRLSVPLSSATLCLCGCLLSGCAMPGVPLAPSLKLPSPATDLTATRAGSQATLHWTVSKRTTDKVPLKGSQRSAICLGSTSSTGCTRMGEVMAEPGAGATYTGTLPAADLEGAPRLLTYTVELENEPGRTAGPSNPAWILAGQAPPAVNNLSAANTAAGIELHWQPETVTPPQGATCVLLLHRTRVLAAGVSPKPSSQEESAGVPQPVEQALEVKDGCTLDHAIDRDAQLNRTYHYSAERLWRVTLSKHPLELASAPTPGTTIDARDLFPPSVPAGLAAVADNQTHAIDLSWSPSPEPDTQGYFVYRRQAGSSQPPQRISGAKPTANVSWHDATPATGTRYAYSVSAVDSSGNESARSPETEETVQPLGHDGNQPQ